MKNFNVAFELTNACNLRCKSCLPASAMPRKNELNTEQIISIIAKLHDVGASHFSFTGGEPLIKPNFFSILDFIETINVSSSLITNGILLNGHILQNFKKGKCNITISLDGSNIVEHDYIRGRGTFLLTLKNIEDAIKKGLDINISCTISQHNINSLESIICLCRDLNCKHVFFSEIVRAGRALDNWENLRLSNTQSAQLPGKLQEISSKLFNTYMYKDSSCWVNGKSIYINSEGLVYLCSEVFQQKPQRYIADLQNDVNWEQLLHKISCNTFTSKPCCYYVLTNNYISLTGNLSKPCHLSI